LEDEEQFFQVVFTLTQVPTRPTPRPLEIKVPHPFQGEAKEHGTRVCVFSKDPARSLKDQLAALKVPCIAKVIGVSKLKKNFKQYKDKRKLLADYDLFLSDLRVYKMLPELLGKEFYSKKKYPCPLKLHGFTDAKELQKQLNQAAKATYFIQGNGPNYSFRVGRSSQEANSVAENIEQSLPYALGYVANNDDIKFSSIQSIAIKVGESPELPIFNQLTKSEILSFITASEQK
jgi:ribosome biogenesis protein UTP30